MSSLEVVRSLFSEVGGDFAEDEFKGLNRVVLKVGSNQEVVITFPPPPTATAAKVIDRFDEGEDGEGDFQAVGSIRKLASASLLDTDKRYSGKTTSRKAWKEDHWEQTLSGLSGE